MSTLHPQALTMTLLLTAERGRHQNDDELEYAVYRVIDQYLGAWPDAKKADLYAQLVEQYDPAARLMETEKLVSSIMWSTENNWASQ